VKEISMTLIQFYDLKLTEGLVKTTSEIPHWLNILMLHTKVQKFLYFSTIGKKTIWGKI